jgi:hypothetical protein
MRVEIFGPILLLSAYQHQARGIDFKYRASSVLGGYCTSGTGVPGNSTPAIFA